MTHQPALSTGQPLDLQLLSPPTFWRCEPSWSWVSRPLPNYLLWCVLDGIGRLELDNRATDLGPGTCAVFAPGDAPTANHDPRRRLLVFGMHFTVGELRSEEDPADVVPEERWSGVRDRVLLGALARSSDAAFRRGDRLGERQAELCLEQLLCLIWEAAHGTPASVTDTVIEEVAQLIRQDPGRDWSVKEMAARASLSRAQFTRRFVAQNGMAPAQYLIKARIDRAHQLLTETGMTVTQVAAALGYADAPYFSRQYKQRTGHSPSTAKPRPAN
ncbi:helix-turn-helix transcriptional regulator [Kribbella qitaiheensis]|uniref:Helix-turn-helix transcriptional regulator n=1 Tax=Kribbella qitaiheensis TaxID=1544730 RepID=A0A7G6WXV3_9ACTN|nr:AraC family transcriptional regulator [Kribbella qitaiheensis]QNE18818.1 helix-turn-helix transcriptional regulator [Kribbella qitaiheensis]